MSKTKSNQTSTEPTTGRSVRSFNRPYWLGDGASVKNITSLKACIPAGTILYVRYLGGVEPDGDGLNPEQEEMRIKEELMGVTRYWHIVGGPGRWGTVPFTFKATVGSDLDCRIYDEDDDGGSWDNILDNVQIISGTPEPRTDVMSYNSRTLIPPKVEGDDISVYSTRDRVSLIPFKSLTNFSKRMQTFTRLGNLKEAAQMHEDFALDPGNPEAGLNPGVQAMESDARFKSAAEGTEVPAPFNKNFRGKQEEEKEEDYKKSKLEWNLARQHALEQIMEEQKQSHAKAQYNLDFPPLARRGGRKDRKTKKKRKVKKKRKTKRRRRWKRKSCRKKSRRKKSRRKR